MMPRFSVGSRLVVVVKRDELAQTLELLKVAKLDPRIVTHPGLVYQNLFQLVRSPTAPGDLPDKKRRMRRRQR